jgi:sugar lactone lactonase YvrE
MRIASCVGLVCLLGCGRSSLVGPSASAQPSPGGGAGVPVAAALHITPPSVKLAPNGTQRFSADRPVAWSVVGPAGGSIDGDGNYSAPATPGSYTVVAAASDGSGLSASAAVTVRPWRLELLAGTLGGAGNADDRGGNARFNQLQYMAYDGAGTLYVVDQYNHAVRKLDVKSGAVTTLVSDQSLYSGSGIVLDGKGALYVSVATFIARVTISDGTMTIVAGVPDQFGDRNGPARQALFESPIGLAWDNTRQRLYIADNSTGVRIYDVGTGQVSSLTDAAQSVRGLAFDGGTQLYLFDENGIARCDVTADTSDGASAPVSYLAGGYQRGVNDGVGSDAHFTWPNQLAIDVAGNALYIADANLRRLDLATSRVTTLGPRDFIWGGAGVALDGKGGLFVGSFVQNAIAHEALDGSGRTVIAGPAQPLVSKAAAYVDATGAAARFNQPAGLIPDGKGALLVADAGNDVIRRVDIQSGAVTSFAGTAQGFDRDGKGSAGQLNEPAHITPDGAGGFVIVETTYNTVRRWNPAGNRLSSLAGTFGVMGSDDGPGAQARFFQPGGACVFAGAAYVADTNNDTIRKIDLASGNVTTLAGSPEQRGKLDGVGAAARLDHPFDIVCDGGGVLYVLDGGNFAIRRVDIASATVSTFFVGVPGYPTVLTRDADYLYVLGSLGEGGSNGPGVQRIRLADGTSNNIAGPRGAQVLVSLTTDGAGNLYTSSRFGTLYRIASDGTITVLANPQGYFGYTDGPLATATFGDELALSYDAGGILVAETRGDKLRRIDLGTATVSTLWGPPYPFAPQSGVGTDVWLWQPVTLARDGGKLYIGEYGIASVDLASQAVSVVDTSAKPAFVTRLGGVVSDGMGHLYFSDTYSSVVGRYDLSDGSLHILAGTRGMSGTSDGVGSAATFSQPMGVALDGGVLYVADGYNDTIRAVRLADNSVTTFAGAMRVSGAVDGVGSAARFASPGGMANDGQGHLFVADTGNGLLRRIDLASATVTTVVGTPGERAVVTGDLPAHLNHPSDVAVLPGGSLAITDEQAVLIVR